MCVEKYFRFIFGQNIQFRTHGMFIVHIAYAHSIIHIHILYYSVHFDLFALIFTMHIVLWSLLSLILVKNDFLVPAIGRLASWLHG